MADETIVTQLVVEADQAIANAQKFREQVQAVKEQLRSLAKDSKQSFADISKGMVSAFKEMQSQKLSQLKLDVSPESFTSAVSKSREDTKQYEQAVRTALSEIRAAYKDTAKVVEQGERAMQTARRKTAQEATRETKQQVAAMRELEKGTKSTSDSTRGFTSVLGGLTRALTTTVLGLSALSILRDVVRWMQDAAKGAMELVKATYALEVGVRALQRSGIEISLKDVYEQIETLKSKYGGLATDAEWRAGTAAFYNLNRDLGFTAQV